MNRIRKTFKLLAVLAFVLFLVIAVVVWRDSAQRNSLISPIREAGDPVSIVDLRPADIDPDENAATYLVPVTDHLQEFVSKVYPIAFSDDYDRQSGLTNEQQQQIETLLAVHGKTDEAIQLASHCNVLNWPLDYASAPSDFNEPLLQYTSLTRQIARFHVAKSRVFQAAGNTDAATNVCLQGLRLVRLQDHTPTIVASIVNNACRRTILDELGGLIKLRKLQLTTYQAIETELAEHDSLSAFVQTLKSERAFGISSFSEFPNFAGAGWVTEELLGYVEYLNEQITMSGEWPFEQKHPATVEPSGMTDTLAPVLISAREFNLRTIAQIRCIRVFNAIQDRQLTSRLLSIKELGLPDDASVDPFSGNELIIKKNVDGWSVYSVGPNQLDDGGQVSSDDAQPLDIGV